MRVLNEKLEDNLEETKKLIWNTHQNIDQVLDTDSYFNNKKDMPEGMRDCTEDTEMALGDLLELLQTTCIKADELLMRYKAIKYGYSKNILTINGKTFDQNEDPVFTKNWFAED